MRARDHNPCYGNMMPGSLHAEYGRPAAGKVFSLVVLSPPGLGRAPRRAEVDRAAWDACVACPEFDPCYRLSMARLALNAAAADV